MFLLRPAQYPDHEAIAQLHAQNWKTTYRGILSDHYLDHEVDTDRLTTWQKRLSEPADNQLVTVAIDNNILVGFCGVFLDDDAHFGTLIDNLHVALLYRKAGLGKVLVKDTAKKVLQKATIPAMYLWVYDANLNAKIAYDRMGGTCVEVVEKEDIDGSVSKICRYAWSDLPKLLDGEK